MKRKKIKGITLIEMVAVIVVLGISIPVLLTMWSDVAWRSSRSEALADATFYAQQLMEEIKSKKFDERSVSPWTNPSNLGPESGEVYPNYNDIDDFNGYSDTPAAGYTRSVAVDYVILNGNTWQSCGSGFTCGTTSNCTNCNECCYKRIQVTVSSQISSITLVAVVAAYK